LLKGLRALLVEVILSTGVNSRSPCDITATQKVCPDLAIVPTCCVHTDFTYYWQDSIITPYNFVAQPDISFSKNLDGAEASLIPFYESSGNTPHFNGEMKASLFNLMGNFSPAKLGKYSLF